MNTNNIGRNSLIVSVLMLIILESLIYIGYLKNDYWSVLSFGFEAATIGGLADWFAVSVLFREIPIPFVKNHTNIIVKSRSKLSEGIADLVTNKWLSVEVVKDKIANISVTDYLMETIDKPTNRDKIIVFLKNTIVQTLENSNNTDGFNKLQLVLKEQLNTVDYNNLLSEWLYKLVEKGEHDALWNFLIKNAEKGIDDKRTQAFLLSMVKEKIKGYEKENLLKGLAVKIASTTGLVDSELIVKKILVSVNEFIYEAKHKENHPLKENYNHKVIELIENVKKGNDESLLFINDFKNRIINIDEIKEIIRPVVNDLKTDTIAMFKEEDSSLSTLLKENVDSLLLKLKTDVVLQDKINETVKNTLDSLIDKYHKEVGALIEDSLSKLNDKELVHQIESKVGNDLQYIRLNGAIVGGFIGLVFSLIRIKILHH